MITTISDRRFNAKFVKEKLAKFKFNMPSFDKSLVKFDLGQIAEATKLHIGRTMEAKRGAGLVFVNGGKAHDERAERNPARAHACGARCRC